MKNEMYVLRCTSITQYVLCIVKKNKRNERFHKNRREEQEYVRRKDSELLCELAKIRGLGERVFR
jgi:hypothetical protein